ncbi:ankyrin repeat domain-containing protein [Novosphingobium beihaiensis]|uniref:Ankyrin repeat domain-containing protein n=1 Tax=Novosphingobium beihaiensis TaxID=2930389 RepID=A0ABT0BNZ6_9SPHN|nr:ankyrin repeat domain-containing protein [Novosphingobium beihaiensis]MCJ2186762.1 ankyrin repeat domain-containing protein [Novosphingobium beihaiensis]
MRRGKYTPTPLVLSLSKDAGAARGTPFDKLRVSGVGCWTALAFAASLALTPSAHASSDPDALARAIRADDTAGTAAVLEAGTSANAALAYNESPLAHAIETQDPALVATLLRHGARPDTADALGLTPLALACERGNGAIVDSLLDARANVRKAGPDGASPLAVCARFAPADTVTRMLAMGAKPEAADARGQTPLMWAASSGNLGAMAALLKAGARVNRVTPGRFTPLAFAIKSGVPEAAKLLLDAGADASWRGPENTSAVQLAMYQKNWGAAALLVERSFADLSARDRNGNQLLHVAAAGGDAGLVALLLAKGADPDGLTGPSKIKWVTEANFGVPPPPVPPTPPLLIAAQNGQTGAMKQLTAAGADTAFVTGNGTNVVLAAAHSHSPEALDYALSLAPDADTADANGMTPLHLLLYGGWHPQLEAMLRVLAQHGARTDIPDKSGKTAAQAAAGGLTTVRDAYTHAFAASP